MRTGLLFMLIGLIIFCCWTTQQTSRIKKAEWLIGTWENKTSRGSVYETWTKTGDNEFSGKSYILKDKDSVIFETIRLVQQQGGLFYIPTVKNQNDGLPVRFALQAISDSVLVFENAQHDFPQIISYTRISADSLVAEISGTKNGEERKQTFPMKRVK
ncbi:DUF6265 family protein [Olivibacter sitiensis]|uniref:DUF6265 family protein n=1 Tax=Olivibacter sitiensis TaxID=376470 RepID=UPI00048521F9|nr:DUF6265 family protein [Olivibacter sitiensis]